MHEDQQWIGDETGTMYSKETTQTRVRRVLTTRLDVINPTHKHNQSRDLRRRQPWSALSGNTKPIQVTLTWQAIFVCSKIDGVHWLQLVESDELFIL
jgi:hypothetical protein